jgi:hypothetical protein
MSSNSTSAESTLYLLATILNLYKKLFSVQFLTQCLAFCSVDFPPKYLNCEGTHLMDIFNAPSSDIRAQPKGNAFL